MSGTAPDTRHRPSLAPSFYALAEETIKRDRALFTKQDDGRATLTGLRVFRTGSFVDAYGFESTYTREHLQEMVDHARLLADVFPNVPFRADHSRSVNNVVGYITKQYLDGDYLVVDMEFTEPDAAAKWERGTYRARSSEIGFYDTNDGAIYYPVLLGVAFVDIPAVEKLYSKDQGGSSDEPPTRYFTEAIQPMNTSNPAQIQVDTAPAQRPPDANVTVALELKPAAAPEAALAAEAKPQTFSFGGRTLTAAEVQAELDRIAIAEKEQFNAARAAFARSLVDQNKLGAPQLDAMAELAQSLDPDQFSKLQAVFAGAPALSILANHGDGISNPDGHKGEPTEAEREIAKLEGIVAFHRRSGMDPKVLQGLESYQRLQALKGNK